MNLDCSEVAPGHDTVPRCNSVGQGTAARPTGRRGTDRRPRGRSCGRSSGRSRMMSVAAKAATRAYWRARRPGAASRRAQLPPRPRRRDRERQSGGRAGRLGGDGGRADGSGCRRPGRGQGTAFGRITWTLTTAITPHAHRNPQIAAAISYHVLFAIVPLFVFLGTIFGLLLRDDQRRQR